MGGEDARIQDNPWQVALVMTAYKANDEAQFCGGSIVSGRWILTAAHCVDAGTKADQIAVLVGVSSLKETGRRVPVEPGGIYIHKEWDFATHTNDIALINVAEDLQGQSIGPWSTSTPEEENRGPSSTSTPTPEEEHREVRITGWGALSWQDSPPFSIILQSVDTQVIPLVKCNASDSYDHILTNKMLCIGKYTEGQKDSCDRDSGGPATTLVNGKRELIGITSWGSPRCGTPKMPGIYTRVSQYVTWVKQTSKGAVNW